MKKILFILLMLSLSYKCLAQKELIGFWEGAIEVMGTQLIIKAEFIEENSSLSGKLDIPQQLAIGLPLSNIQLSKDSASFELFLNPGNIASFSGILSKDSVQGDFSQAGVKGTFYLAKSEKKEEKSFFLPAEYIEEEVVFYNDDIKFTGTLSYPKAKGPFPAIILISGSGQQERDEDVAGFKVFALIANYLSNTGFAVLRYDDRGMGGSDAGNLEEATSKTFAEDAFAAFTFLSQRKEIDPKKIGFLGHSEGAMIGTMLAAEHKEIAFLVLMAGPGVTGEQIILSQIEAIIRASGASEEEIQHAIKSQERIMEAVKTDRGWEEIKEMTIEDLKKSIVELPAEARSEIDISDSALEERADLQIKGVRSKWYRFFIQYDPAKDLEKVKCPVLALFGEKDLQVLANLNETAMKNALEKAGNKNFTTKIFKDANHLFQKADSGLLDEYAFLEKKFVDGYLEYIIDWLQENFTDKKR